MDILSAIGVVLVRLAGGLTLIRWAFLQSMQELFQSQFGNLLSSIIESQSVFCAVAPFIMFGWGLPFVCTPLSPAVPLHSFATFRAVTQLSVDVS